MKKFAVRSVRVLKGRVKVMSGFVKTQTELDLRFGLSAGCTGSGSKAESHKTIKTQLQEQISNLLAPYSGVH